MKKLLFQFGVLLLLLVVLPRAEAEELFGVEADNLVTIDTATGVRTVVGPVGAGFGVIQGMAFDPTVDKLFAIGNSITDGMAVPGPRLIELDRSTGQATEVGPLIHSIVGQLAIAEALAFNPGDGLLYGAGSNAGSPPNSFSNLLFTVNPATGAATAVADVSGTIFSGGKDVDSLVLADGTAYVTDCSFCTLHTLNLATGVATPVTTDTTLLGFDAINDLAFDPAAGTLFGIGLDFTISAPRSFLLTINRFTGGPAVVVGSAHFDTVNALAFAPPVSVPDPDSDGDGVPDIDDVCPGGDDNADADGDLIPDFCDACPIDPQNDVDGDGLCAEVDACPLDPDNDIDGDGVCGDIDFCPLDSANDVDGDGVCGDVDVCPLDPDNDVDGDGVCGEIDNCPIVANSNQDDADGDNVGDACDFDNDNDTICDGPNAVETICTAGPDNCPLVSNTDQADFDVDGAGDVCDGDDDNDGVVDNADECPATVTGVVNADGCSVGDLCPCLNNWKNHGAYVRCIAHTSEDFVAASLITEVEKDTIVSDAGMSSCGAKK